MAKSIASAFILTLLLAAAAAASQPAGTTALGVRLGLFTNKSNELNQPNDEVKLFGNRTNFYVEAYANYYLTRWLAGVLNLGSYSKGDITFDVYVNGVFDGQFLGQASIFPMQLGLKVSPFSTQFPGKARPYLEGGGAFIIGRETATLGPYDSYWARYTDGSVASESDWGWWLGGGAEIPLTEALSFDTMVKYLDNKFNGDIAGISNYSGWQFSIGIVYVFLRK